MSAQAGWYAAPGEQGMLRWWSGELWTEDRQPLPEPEPEPQPPAPVGVPVSLAPAQATASAATLPAVAQPWTPGTQQGVEQTKNAIATLEHAGTMGEFVGGLVKLAESGGVGLSVGSGDGVQFGSGTAGAGGGVGFGFGNVTRMSATRAPGRAISFGRWHTTTGGAIMGIAVGLLFLVIGLVIIGSTAHGATVGVGETKTTGVVSSQGWDTGDTSGESCFPLANYVVAGAQYTARSNVGSSPCPVQVGQTVDVIYTTASPGTSGRIPASGAATWLMFLFPLVGGGVFLISLLSLIKGRRSA